MGNRPASARFWLIDLRRYTGLPQGWAALLVAIVLLGISLVAGVLPAVDGRYARLGIGAALFFATTVGLLVAGIGLVMARTRANLIRVRGSFDCNDETFDAFLRHLEAPRTRASLLLLMPALALGFSHDYWLHGATWALLNGREMPWHLLGALVGTLAIWLVMFQIAMLLFSNGKTVSSFCARHLRVTALASDGLGPLGQVAIQPAVLLLVVQAAYPLLWIDSSMTLVSVLPGFLATLVVLVGVVLAPLRGAHQRIQAAKHKALADVRRQLQTTPFSTRPEDVHRMNELAALKERLLAVSEWPINAPVLRRLAFYVVIPPLAWVGAALMEMAVTAAL